MKRVNPKSIKISDEIEKRPKWGVIVIFQVCRRFGTCQNRQSCSRAPTRDRMGTGSIRNYKRLFINSNSLFNVRVYIYVMLDLLLIMFLVRIGKRRFRTK